MHTHYEEENDRLGRDLVSFGGKNLTGGGVGGLGTQHIVSLFGHPSAVKWTHT